MFLHHSLEQTITFGVVFSCNENTEIFMWFFETFLKYMNGEHLRAIIINQCRAIEKVIPITFLRAYHHLYIWHILKKKAKKLGALAYRKEFYAPFHKCIYDAHSKHDFELQ